MGGHNKWVIVLLNMYMIYRISSFNPFIISWQAFLCYICLGAGIIVIIAAIDKNFFYTIFEGTRFEKIFCLAGLVVVAFNIVATLGIFIFLLLNNVTGVRELLAIIFTGFFVPPVNIYYGYTLLQGGD